MKTIGLIAAMKEECQPLLRRVGQHQSCRMGRFPAWRFQLGERDCLLVQSGMGLKHASAAAHALLAEASPQVMVSFGVAGAAREGPRIGDVVALGSVALLAAGTAGPPLPLTRWSAEAQQAITAALQPRGASFWWGTALTTPGSQLVGPQADGLENPLLEMETAAIAQACAETGVPLMVLRGVSDNPAEPLPLDLGSVVDENARLRPARLLAALARRPTIVFKVRRLYRNIALAAENTALALLAALERM